MSHYPYWHELFAILMFLFTFIMIILSVSDVRKYIRRENAKLFKAMVYMQNRLLSPKELDEVYTMECKKHGFKKI